MWVVFLRGSPKALMTLPKARRPQLIWMLSFSLSPVFPVFTIPGGRWCRGSRPAPRRCSMVTVKMVCERLDCLLMWVAPVCLAVFPISSRLSTSSSPSTSDSFTPQSTANLTTLPLLSPRSLG
uniref:Uncharacterized protein n=1 Tax=Corvus moneduloides TaxID=1196302 RepID=A0A8C3EDZ2_CORMO